MNLVPVLASVASVHFVNYFWDTILKVVSKPQIRFKDPALLSGEVEP